MKKSLETAINVCQNELSTITEELQGKLDNLNDKQSERETDARAEKISELEDKINRLESAIEALDALNDF